MNGDGMTIGKVAAASAVPTKTIRYYESIGLIPPADRRDNGYRSYTPRALEELRFIKRARGLGFPLDEVESLLALWRDKHRASAEVKALAQRQIVASPGRDQRNQVRAQRVPLASPPLKQRAEPW